MVFVVIRNDSFGSEIDSLFGFRRGVDHLDTVVFEFVIFIEDFVDVFMIDIVAEDELRSEENNISAV